MPGAHGRDMLPRRRRRDDEAEDESSTAGDLDDFSVSEGSALSNGPDDGDGEGSDISAEDDDARTSITEMKAGGDAAAGQNDRTRASATTGTTTTPGARQSSSLPTIASNDRREMEEGSHGASGEAHLGNDGRSTGAETTTTTTMQPSGQPETPSERARLDHQEYIRQRNSNPAFVPNRGGFFLHDDRTAASSSSPYGRPFHRGRGRGFNNGFGVSRGFGQPVSRPTDRQWSHDLHDTVNKKVTSPPARDTPASFQIPTAKPAATAPNRTFSVSTVLGNVTVHILLPGMENKRTFQSVVKKQHTLLPQHRPPLRRDKPVRISIPDEDPRYIFPSAERSFIFIPRAMRPNQQIYTRGRGRGSFHGSRRPSIMGSTYTPSVGMSRRSSLGGAGSTGLLTPTDGSIPRGPLAQNFNRAIVRMPIAPISGPIMQPPQMPIFPISSGSVMPFDQYVPGSTILHSPSVALPIHQPRPQKNVSVADIESPAFKAPQQQQEQPFHQQMPPGVSLADGAAAQHAQVQPNLMMNTPLSHIPEGAVYAQPFQPYPMYPQGYYGAPFAGAPMMFSAPSDPYTMGMGGPMIPQQFAPGPQTFAPTAQPGDQGAQQGPMAHESNGMVYYYDPTQFPADGSSMPQYPTAVGGGMMDVQAAGQYFYPAMQGGVYFTPTAQ